MNMKSKKNRIIVFILLLSQSLYGQWPAGTTWEYSLCLDVLDCCPQQFDCRTVTYHIGADTAIDNQMWQKLLVYDIYHGEDTLKLGFIKMRGDKIFYRGKLPVEFEGYTNYEAYNDTVNYLVYDFSLGKGDSIKKPFPLHVSNSDTINYAGAQRRRFTIHKDTLQEFSPNAYPEYWIEGIGSTFDLLYPLRFKYHQPFPQTSPEGWHLNSFCSGDCFFYTSSRAQLHLPSIDIFPNPVSDIVTLKMPSASIGNILIYNLQGKLVLKNKINERETQISVRALEAGIYYVVARTKSEVFNTKMIKL